MGSKTSSQTNQQSTTTADPQAAADYTGVINRARQVSKTPYTAYSGELTAPVNAQETTATNALNGLGAAANSTFGQAAQQSGLGAAAVNPSNVGLGAIQKYMSPYQSDVVSSTEAELNQQDQIQQQQQTGSAIGAGAFGGDRAGVAAAALAGQQDLANNSTIANLNNTNYSQALSEANTQQQVGLGAAQANRAAVQQDAATLAGIGSAQTSAGLGVANAQLGAGALQQQTQQASDTAEYGQFLQQQAYPFQTEQYLANIVGGIAPNYGSSTEGQSTTQTSLLNSIIGGATIAGAAAPSLSGLGTIGSGIGNAVTGIGNWITSDRRAKEDIRQAGALFDGLPVYTFRYKGSPVTQLGLIAQDVEKKYPRAVRGLGGLRHVDYSEATDEAVDKGHFARGGRAAGLGDLRYRVLLQEEVDHAERQARATGGSVSPYSDAESYVSGTPYAGAQGYVPASQGLGAAKMLASPLPAPSQPTSPIPNFNQFAQAGQGLGSIATGASNVASDVSAYNAPPNAYGLPFGGGHADGGRVKGLGLAAAAVPRLDEYDEHGRIRGLGAAVGHAVPYAEGGKVKGLGFLTPPPVGSPRGLGAVRVRRGYDGGGVVPADDLVFDPSAVGPAQTLQAGLGAAAMPAGFAPTPTPQGLGVVAAAAPQGSPQGLGFAAQNDNAPVPVAPAPVMTPVVGYQQSDGTVTPTAGLGNLPKPPTPLGGVMGVAPQAGLGAAVPQSAPAAIDDATAPRSVRNNNPGNIVDGPFARNMPGYAGSDGRFAIFDTAANGADAMDGLLDRYGRQGLVTPMQIISKWSPAGDGSNDPAAYAGTVAKTLGIGVNDPIDMTNPTQRAALAQAMAKVEAGSGRGTPSSALGYAGGGLGSTAPQGSGLGLGAVAQPVPDHYRTGLGAGLYPPADDTPKARGLAGVLGFGPGGDGGLLGLSDDQRDALIATGAGIMQSTSKSPGIAIGEGIGKGLAYNQSQQALNREAGLAKAQAANLTSEAQNRTAMQGIEHDRVKIAADELTAHLRQIEQEGRNFQSEDVYRKSLTGNEATRIALDRYQLYPGPDGQFRYLDKANPGRGLLTASQVPELNTASGAPAGSSGGGGGAPATFGTPATGSAAAPGTAPVAMNGPSALKSDDFLKTGRPTLVTPQGYMPTNWWGNSVRMQGDPVAREAAAAQTKEDVTNAAVAAQKANTALYYSDEMDRNMDTLSKSGLLVPGAAFPERLNLAKSYNLAANAIGLPTVDEKTAAAGQSLLKDQTRLASQLTSSLGSREAASVFSSMMAATPSASNTMAGYRQISSSIRVLAQRDVDRNAFVQNYQSRYGSTGEADAAFNTLNPPMMYARQAQAIARVKQEGADLLRNNANDPRAVAAFERTYGPGTARYFTGGL